MTSPAVDAGSGRTWQATWLPAAAATLVGAAALLALGFGIITDCTSNPECTTETCFGACDRAFYRSWRIASVGLVAVAVLAVRGFGTRGWLALIPATFAAGIVLIATR
ncbi:MAG: hypothetical protein JWP66_965 [Naasia sp.]|nr:hypothetical protein [Naasia sp.]